MTTNPNEVRRSLLASFYSLEPGEVMEVALSNLHVVAAYQAGRDKLPAEQVFRLLLAPQLPGPTPHAAQKGVSKDDSPKPTNPMARHVLAVARTMTAPFTASDLVGRVSEAAGQPVGARVVGGLLSSAGWPWETGAVRRGATVWLPVGAGGVATNAVEG